MEKQLVPPAVLEDIEYVLRVWDKMANRLLYTLIFLGLTAIASSLCISAFADILNTTAIRIISFAGTLALTVINAFSLGRKGNNVRNGWRLLNKALYSYKSELIDASSLIRAYEEGEALLGDVDFNYDSARSPKQALQQIKHSMAKKK